ncbi:MAG: D-glycero-alpha-D-manno-heptose-1,7-bisphosphate 7-phosphatase [Dehalococcoidia bacterium]
MNRVVFMDKDGTLVENVPYNADPAQIRLAPNARRAIMRLVREDYAIVIVTNQSGIAKGMFPESAMRAVEDRICELFAPMGARLAGFYYCPHHPDGSVSDLAIECDCRKPAAGLITRAAEELGIDPGESWMVGDTLDDVEAGNRAGCRTILVDNGNETEWRVDGKRWPSVVVNDLDRAAAVIVGVEEPVKAQYTK